MSNAVKDQYSDDEWFLISSVPSLVGAAMAGAGKSGIIGTAKEAMASMKTMVAGKSDYPDNELINAVLVKAESFSDAKEKAGAFREKAIAQFKEEQESQEYQQWCINVAKKVAEAASEGGFMGFGGEQVSDGERALMAELQKVFTVMS